LAVRAALIECCAAAPVRVGRALIALGIRGVTQVGAGLALEALLIGRATLQGLPCTLHCPGLARGAIVLAVIHRHATQTTSLRRVPRAPVTRTYAQGVSATRKLACYWATQAIAIAIARSFAGVAKACGITSRDLVPTVAPRLALLQLGAAALVVGERCAAHHVATAILV